MFRFRNKVQLIKKVREQSTDFWLPNRKDNNTHRGTLSLKSCLNIVNLIEKEVGKQLWEKL